MTNKINHALSLLSNPTVAEYLDLMHDTEPPPLFHVWSLLSAASACMTRRCWFDMGPIRIMPNQYIMLVGAPGVRKSTAVSFAKRMLSEVKGLRLAPNSTGGHMQGLITAMCGPRSVGMNPEAGSEDAAIQEALDAMNGIGFAGVPEEVELELQPTHVQNRSALYVAEGELTSFLGMKRDDFINFLGDMWDKSGEAEHVYQLKREKIRIGLPCLNLIGGITPMHITTYLPPQAIGQGFTSRVILVFSEYRKRVPWPDPLDEKKFAQFKQLMGWIFADKEGPFEHTREAKRRIIDLYDYKVAIEDARFIHYAERRQTHMLKIAMALCALRMDNIVTAQDIDDAHALLVLTEANMTEALGEYGLSPLALAKARVSDILRMARQPMSLQRILIAAGSDVARADVAKALHEMNSTGQIIEVVLADSNGIERTGYVWPMEENPFVMNQRIKVDYLLADNLTAKARGNSAVKKLASRMQDGEQDDEQDESERDDPGDHGEQRDDGYVRYDERSQHSLAAKLRGAGIDHQAPAAPAARQTVQFIQRAPAVSAAPGAPSPSSPPQGHTSVRDKLMKFLHKRKETTND